mgnify:FL=1
MRIGYNPEQLFDATGVPLSAGRVSLFVHDSGDVPLHVYSLSGDVWHDAANPIILDDEGRMDTVWFDAAIVDIKVEKNTDGVYESVDTYQYGFNPPEVHNDTLVYGIGGLADANPELETVTVVGYHSTSDCGPRVYVWDPTCTDPEDGGCIIASTQFAEGRWLLVSDLEYMPSSYYGIRPGSDEANMAAFLSYPERLGQWRIPTPPVPRFLPGTYTTNGSMSSTRRVAFDRGAKFTRLTLSCYSVEVQPNSDYVCDFILTKDQAVAHSSWFRNAERFWSCNAAELLQDPYNFFESDEMTATRGIANARVSGPAMAMTGAGRLEFTNCSIADHALSTDWYTGFTGMSFTDRWFVGSNWDFAPTTAGGHRIRLNVSNCDLELSNIDDANVYLLAMAANGQTAIDMQDRTVSTVTGEMPFVQIINMRANYAHFNHGVVLEDCTIAHLYMENSAASLTAGNSSFSLYDATASEFILRDCQVVMECSLDTLYTGVTAVRCTVGMTDENFWQRLDPAVHLSSHAVTLDGCIFNGGEIQGSGIVARNCSFVDCTVRNVAAGIPGAYTLSLTVEGCTFSGTGYLVMAPGVDDHSAMDVYDVTIGTVSIKDNSFSTTMQGVRCPFWAQDLEHRFLRGCCGTVDVTDVQASWLYGWYYQGNTGNCPRSYGESLDNFNDGLVKQIAFGSGAHDTVRFCGTTQSVFCMPVLFGDGGSNAGDEWVVDDTALACTPFKGLAVPYNPGSADRSAAFPTTMYLPACAVDKTLHNDMFNVYLGGGTAVLFAGAVPVPAGQ